MSIPPSLVQYQELQTGFEFFNEELFRHRLTDCLIVFSRNPRTHGYLAPERWVNETGDVIHGLGLSAETFTLRDPEIALSTLVHEMCHSWQQDCGDKKSRQGYHNREWGEKMEELGLIPSSTGEPGGKRTGQGMSHYIDYDNDDGLFLPAALHLIETGWEMPWKDVVQERPERRKTKWRYICPKCDSYAGGKDNLKLACMSCEALMPREPDPDAPPDPQVEAA